jgi:hypothetical protein
LNGVSLLTNLDVCASDSTKMGTFNLDLAASHDAQRPHRNDEATALIL